MTLIEGEMPVLPISSPKVISLEGCENDKLPHTQPHTQVFAEQFLFVFYIVELILSLAKLPGVQFLYCHILIKIVIKV